MAKNIKNSVDSEEENVGRIKISEDVVAVIAGIAATEAEGVDSLIGHITTENVAKLSVSKLSKGVRIRMIDETVFVYLALDVKYGCSVPGVCKDVQEKVSSAVETMTGLTVAEVNITVADVIIDKK